MDISTRPTPLRATAGGVPEDGLSRPLAAVLAAARRRAARCGDRVPDTAHLLHGLLESDPAVRESVGGGWPRTAKLLGYLAQRCIGYGLHWRHTVEEAHGPHAAALAPDSPYTAAGWSPAAAAALTGATGRAAARGARSAEGVDLFAALAADPECRAAEVLRTAGIEVRSVAGDGAARADVEADVDVWRGAATGDGATAGRATAVVGTAGASHPSRTGAPVPAAREPAAPPRPAAPPQPGAAQADFVPCGPPVPRQGARDAGGVRGNRDDTPVAELS